MLRQIVLRDATTDAWLVFADPLEVRVARNPAEVVPVLEQAERQAREEGRYAAGFVSYEAAPAFDPAFVTRPGAALPLACFGIFAAPERLATLPEPRPGALQRWTLAGSRAAYLANIAAIRRQIEAGNTYQVNYTVRQRAAGLDDPWSFFLRIAADAPYGAWVDLGARKIVSASPELFFELDGERVTCRPMKGTAPRGLTAEADLVMRRQLEASAKDRAENVMIVDMVRNDLGRVARPDTVRVPVLFETEKYRTVWQLTSTVTGSTDCSVVDLFRALFPSASITGAPKVASMQIIAGLEASPREAYTGAIGYIAPARRARFNVAIRTAVVEESGEATYGVGGGIVWDSVAEDEYQECLNKTRVLERPLPAADFCLLETMLWTPAEGYRLLDEHLDRLAASADYFDFGFRRAALARHLDALARTLDAAPRRVRLLLERGGTARTEVTWVGTGAQRPRRVALAASPIDPGDPFLYHKTTERALYDAARAAAPGCDDVLLWNPDGCVTEATTANLLVQIQGRLYTPPVECGLLDGTLRRKLVRDGVVRERRIRVDELACAEELKLANSVRGIVPCELDEASLARCRGRAGGGT